MLLTSQSHLPHAAFFVAAKSLLPQGKSSRHQTEAGNVLLCLEDEPYKGRAFLKKKNTVHYCNFISSQSLNHSSHPNPKNKTLLRFPKFPAGRSREKKQRSLFGSLCFVIELLDVLIERICNILFRVSEQLRCISSLFFLFSQIYLLDFANTVTNTSR